MDRSLCFILLFDFGKPLAKILHQSSDSVPPTFTATDDGCLHEQALPPTWGSQLTSNNGVFIRIIGGRRNVLRGRLFTQSLRQCPRDEVLVGSDPTLAGRGGLWRSAVGLCVWHLAQLRYSAKRRAERFSAAQQRRA
jgi:hypothetical protein